ncbi:hypothetical protein NM688_g5778 [Phlebia brevispora]|uniref:Uncharacterized protein n=1 Tax=Phlebia brevispora TaxID=194682 RepID=A0ACC1SPZ0_9APHY|nr:hypothetical protein NM688_g5778 [Phlebia brevispora]
MTTASQCPSCGLQSIKELLQLIKDIENMVEETITDSYYSIDALYNSLNWSMRQTHPIASEQILASSLMIRGLVFHEPWANTVSPLATTNDESEDRSEYTL